MIRRLALLSPLLALSAFAAEPHRSFYDLPSSNGWGAVVVDFQRARAHHLRDHLFATEEPRIDAMGNAVWTEGTPSFPEHIATRDLLYDAYFGVSWEGPVGPEALWLPDVPVALDESGWEPGTNIVSMVQERGGLRFTTHVWAPWDLPRSAAVFVLEIESKGAQGAVVDVAALLNMHLGEGRPGPTRELGAQNETIVLHDGAVEERGFAGVAVSRALDPTAARTSWHSGSTDPDPYGLLVGGDIGFADAGLGDRGVHDDSVAYRRWDAVNVPAGGDVAVGFVVAHHGDPFAYATLNAELEDWIAGRDGAGVLDGERAGWASFQRSLTLPAGLNADEDRLFRQSAAVLRMAQVRETSTYLREHLTADGEPRYSRFGPLPGVVEHLGAGGMLASLPPGQWGYAWPRDAAYAVAGMSLAGMHTEARAALLFQLDAETDLFRGYSELAALPIEPYSVSLCRHHGFGVEESDTLGDGDFNFEFDGAGLYLWSLMEYVRASGDWSIVEENWSALRDRVAGFLPPLIVDVEDGALIAADSSIWETHWFGKERRWGYTAVTAVRGLCDAADMADYMGETAVAEQWRVAAEHIRRGIALDLTDDRLAIASNREELESARALGTRYGYADGAVTEAVAMGLFDPLGGTAVATLNHLREQLETPDGPGLIRNDDFTDELGLSPWGSTYDASEWVIIDLRTSLAAREVGDVARADELLAWVHEQSVANYDAIGETYDPITADYTNNAPMVGFGPGTYILALAHRSGEYVVEPACGSYGEERILSPGDDDDAADDDDWMDDDDSTGDDDDSVEPDPSGCACSTTRPHAPGLALLLLPLLRRRIGPRVPVDKVGCSL